MSHSKTDQQLADNASSACQNGRREDVAFLLGELYVRGVFSKMAQRIHTARGNPQAVAAEDLENELWLHLQNRICNFDPAAGPFEAWLYTLTKNLMVDLLRKSNRHPGEFEDAPAADRIPEPSLVPQTVSQAETDALWH